MRLKQIAEYLYLHSPDFIRYAYYRHKYNLPKSLILHDNILIDGEGDYILGENIIIGSRSHLTIPKGRMFIIHDNTHISNDVRITGYELVESEYLKGKDTALSCNVMIGKSSFIEPYNFLTGHTLIPDNSIKKRFNGKLKSPK